MQALQEKKVLVGKSFSEDIHKVFLVWHASVFFFSFVTSHLRKENNPMPFYPLLYCPVHCNFFVHFDYEVDNSVLYVSIHPPPAFGSSPNLEALALGASKSPDEAGDTEVDSRSMVSQYV